MKARFQPIVRSVELRHGDQVIVLTLRPLPLGYGQLTSLWIPDPSPKESGRFINGKPELLQPTDAERAAARRTLNMCRLGYSLGDQVQTARPPDGAPLEAWIAYDAELWAEFEAAGLFDADVARLMEAFYEVCAGVGEPKKD